jgi:hypothetical protein
MAKTKSILNSILCCPDIISSLTPVIRPTVRAKCKIKTKHQNTMVRAKFKVVKITDQHEGESKTIDLEPVIGGSPENETFYKYTPSGSIQLSTVNAAAAEQFEVAAEYFVDFTRAE